MMPLTKEQQLAELVDIANVRGLTLTKARYGAFVVKRATTQVFQTRDLRRLRQWLAGVESVMRTA